MNIAIALAALLLSPFSPEKGVLTIERGEGVAWSFRHTGARNWAVNITDRMPVTPGDRYEIRCDTAALDDAGGRFSMNVCLFDADGKAVDWHFANEAMKPGRKVVTRFTVPAGVARMYARFRGDGPCAARVDAFSLERKGSVFPEGYVAPQEPELVAAAIKDFDNRDTFDGDRGVSAALIGAQGFFLRDVAANGEYRPAAACGDFALTVTTTNGDGSVGYDVTLRELTGRDRAVSLVFAVKLPDGPLVWHETMRKSEPVTQGERQYTVRQGNAGRGRLSRWPFGAVSVAGKGVALGMDPRFPAFQRFGANASTRHLYVVFDFGFGKEHPEARVKFRVFRFDGAHGLRGAYAAYRRIYPEMFEVRCREHGLWTVASSLKKLPGLEDFGFRFRGRMGEIPFDDEHGFLTFRYTEPSTWWVTVPKEKCEAGYSFEDGVDICERLAASEESVELKTARADPSPVRRAKAWKTSVILDEEGKAVGSKCKRSWCEGILWALNSAPGIGGPGALNDFRAKIGPDRMAERYAAPFPQGLDGEYYDSAEMYVTPWCDFCREHFAGMATPLVFDRDSFRPAVYKGMIAYEYIRGASDLAHAHGRLTLANCTPINWWYLVPFLDVPGSEIWWVKESADGKIIWAPMDDENFLYRRSMCGGKPLCFLMDAPFDHFTKEMTEKYFQRSVAYGALPSFFTWHGVSTFGSNLYYSRPDLYERDRPLFKKYIPIAKRLSEAGWEPINRLLVSPEAEVITEQFGDRLATVFNLGETPRKLALKVLDGAVGAVKELVTGETLKVENGTLALELAPETVRVFEF